MATREYMTSQTYSATIGGVVYNVTASIGTLPGQLGLFNVKSYGAAGDGVTNDTSAIQAAIDAAEAAGGGEVVIPRGSYIVSGLSVVTDQDDREGVTITGSGQGATKLLASANGVTIMRWSASWGGIHGVGFDGNGYTGVTGLAVIPENPAQTTTIVQRNYNDFSSLRIEYCAEGIVMQCGPYISGSSGCYFNSFSNVRINRCTRGLWLKDGPNALCSGVNRNQFFGLRIGLACNTGIQIDSGDTNSFFGPSFEGIDTGTSPSATPTAIIIEQAGATSTRDNNFNMFFGAMFEDCDIDIACKNKQTAFVGHTAVGSKMVVDSGKMPGLMLGPNGATAPQFIQAQYWNDGSNATDPTTPGVFYVTSDPSTGAGLPALRGSIAMALIGSTGKTFTKHGTADTAWSSGGVDTNIFAAADDVTPSVAGARFLSCGPNTGATAITQLDDGVAWQTVTVFCTSNTNPVTIVDGGNFSLSANWTPGSGDTLTVMTSNGTAWFEVCRSNN